MGATLAEPKLSRGFAFCLLDYKCSYIIYVKAKTLVKWPMRRADVLFRWHMLLYMFSRDANNLYNYASSTALTEGTD